ncbi:ATP-binding protein [Gemmatimonas groenlandica]|uniref:histidine kinase n=1 Tax=Gemmatimonas groenlandica TaxID=2732249 RepID=A0A6M4IMJ5_9BACT|nr:ATP-binding protein [Gemmatimonas groenlandica]QJR34636.1 PAS domain-containing protein [Gemmatimonas groenlandica]
MPEFFDVLHDPARLRLLRDASRPRAYPESAYDSLTRVAAQALDVPVVLVSLVDDKGQFFQGATGLLGEIAVCRATPLSHSFCKHVVMTGAVLSIEDARSHPLVFDNPTIEEMGVVGYLGFPLTTSDGHTLGSLCALTMSPRVWTPQDEATLRDLAQMVISDLELRAELSHREDSAEATDPSVLAEGLPTRGVDILDHMLEGAVALDRHWRITLANRAAARLTRVSRSIAVGQDLWTLLPMLIGTPIEQLLREAAASRRPLEAEAFLPAQARWFEIRAVPARHGLAVYFADTTERRRAIESLALREDQLRQAQKMEAIGTLAGGVAHDFNNLLTVMRANCELLMDDLTPTSPTYDELSDIRAAVARAASLTQQLLAFGRKQSIQPRHVDIATTVESLTPMLRRLIPAGIHIDTRHEPNLPTVFIDPGQVEQVAINLIVNARDAMPNGGTIGVECVSLRLTEPLTTASVTVPEGRWLELTVRDSGVGIPTEFLSRIFDPFFTTKDVGKGTGLGLSTVFGIVHKAGGMITVDSRVGSGTRVRVFFPASSEEQDAAPSLSRATGAETRTLLLV